MASARGLKIFIDDVVHIAGKKYKPEKPPKGIEHNADLGIMTPAGMQAQRVHAWPPPNNFVGMPRAVIASNGDYLVGFAAGSHGYSFVKSKSNDMLVYRSTDKGRSWEGPKIAWESSYNQASFLPICPKGSSRIIAISTEPHPKVFNGRENSGLAMRYSDDHGSSWSSLQMIQPVNDPHFRGVALMQLCETSSGAWLLGAHLSDKKSGTHETRQFVLRTSNQGRKWSVLPFPRPHGWHLKEGRLENALPVALSDGRVNLYCQTTEGYMFVVRSADDGKSWSRPERASLVHPDQPPMVFRYDPAGKTLIALVHNRYKGPGGVEHDGSELWVTTSEDGGQTWAPLRFFMANSAAAGRLMGSRDASVTAADLFVDGTRAHFFFRWQSRQIIHVRMDLRAIRDFPEKL